MSFSSALDRLHSRVKSNNWFWLFSLFCRFTLALGFIPAGIVKIMDERFASGLSANHPMGHYLEALHLTGYYYTFIGIAQIAAAIFLLIPRTVTLGAFLYFPIILNICILTYATRFNGSMFTAPLMTLANLYLLAWNYEKWKYILPFNHLPNENSDLADNRSFFDRYGIGALHTRFRKFLKQLFSDKFPFLFAAGVFAAVVICVIGIPSLYSVKPHNELPQCLRQFKDTRRTQAGANFCNCIHQNGEPLNVCLNNYNNAVDDTN
jgi:uncharacterized membrane protein YphA (DoxX/SURF4 family)